MYASCKCSQGDNLREFNADDIVLAVWRAEKLPSTPKF
jgi:hypothetical protein